MASGAEGYRFEPCRSASDDGTVRTWSPDGRGLWPEGVQRTRKWWYRSVEEEKEVNLAMRFTLSQQGVVAGIPPSFLDLLDKAIQAARSYQPPTESELDELKQIAKTCESIFQKEEAQVACASPFHGPVFPESPHECGCGHYA